MTAQAETMLETLAVLSREFGGPAYVKGGGGNTSAKSASTLWIKPSGTALQEMTPARFVALDRARELGRARSQFFGPELQDRMRKRPPVVGPPREAKVQPPQQQPPQGTVPPPPPPGPVAPAPPPGR